MAGKKGTCRNECNKYDLTATHSISDLLIIMIGPGGLLLVISSPPPTTDLLAVSQLHSFMGGGLQKSSST
jgi:hypothetical protein